MPLGFPRQLASLAKDHCARGLTAASLALPLSQAALEDAQAKAAFMAEKRAEMAELRHMYDLEEARAMREARLKVGSLFLSWQGPRAAAFLWQALVICLS